MPHTLTCSHCRTEFTHNSPRARYCQRTTACREARDEHIKQRNHKNWYRWKEGSTRKIPPKRVQVHVCRHCGTEFEGRTNQVYCRSTAECLRAAYAFYQARRRELYEANKDKSRRETAKLKGKKRMCVVCHKTIKNANYFFCGHCHTAVSTYYVDPQATQYDSYRGQPRL